MRRKKGRPLGRPKGSRTVNRTPTPDRVTVAQAAYELQMSPYDLRWFMSYGMVDLGFVKDDPKQSRRHFVIYRAKLNAEKASRGLV